jgi:hypothetical protein
MQGVLQWLSVEIITMIIRRDYYGNYLLGLLRYLLIESITIIVCKDYYDRYL